MDQIYILPILLFSVVIHEVAHGWMALRLGDPTAREMGRLTLNPIPHIDPVGSVLVPLFSLFVAGRVFIAWARPVPINPLNFSHYRRDDILVAIVGPCSNFILAFLCTVVVICIDKFVPSLPGSGTMVGDAMVFIRDMFVGGITLNVVLALFNMIPIPPLDGSHVVASLLPPGVGSRFRNIGFLGVFLVLILMRWHPFAQLFSWMIGTLILPFDMLYSFFVK